MVIAAWLLAGALAQENEGVPKVEDERALRLKIGRLRERQDETDRDLREAVERGDLEGARRHAQLHRRREQEIEELQKRLDELEAARGRRKEWYERVHVLGEGLLTHWDDDLELEDGAGWGAAVAVRDFLFFEFRRWDTDDEQGDGDASVSAYLIGSTYEFGLAEERKSAFVIGLAAGGVRFSTGAAGGDGDTGLLLSVRPEWKHYFSAAMRLNAGAAVDVARTRFNQDHTHTVHSFSLFFSIEWAF